MMEFPPNVGLSEKMLALAKSDHPRADELRENADAFSAAASGFYAELQTVDVITFMVCWARARRLYSECTGEPII